MGPSFPTAVPPRCRDQITSLRLTNDRPHIPGGCAVVSNTGTEEGARLASQCRIRRIVFRACTPLATWFASPREVSPFISLRQVPPERGWKNSRFAVYLADTRATIYPTYRYLHDQRRRYDTAESVQAISHIAKIRFAPGRRVLDRCDPRNLCASK